jgi:hypothetical protein
MLGDELLGELLLGGDPEVSPIEIGLRRFVMDAVGSGVKVFYVRRPQTESDMPCIVITKDSEERQNTIDKPATTAIYGFTLQVWSYDPKEATDIYNTHRAALERFKGIMMGKRVWNVWVETDVDDSEQVDDGSDDQVFGRSTTYQMIVDD